MAWMYYSPFSFFTYPISLGYSMYGMFANLATIPLQFVQAMLMIYLLAMMSEYFPRFIPIKP